MPVALLYHAVREPLAGEGHDGTLFVAPDRFAWQLDQLARRGFRTLTLAEHRRAAATGAPLPGRVLLTFDDAFAHVVERVTPLLEEHGFTAALFVPVAHIGDGNDWEADDAHLPRMRIATAAQLEAAVRGPWELGSHGFSHVDLRTLAQSERRRQLLRARSELSEIAREPVDALAYPFGLVDTGVRRDAAAAGYTSAFTAGRGEGSDPFALPRRPVRGQEGEKAFLVKAVAGFEDVFDRPLGPPATPDG